MLLLSYCDWLANHITGDVFTLFGNAHSRIHLARRIHRRPIGIVHALEEILLLQQLLGLPRPHYHHHRLIFDDTGGKLSKSRGSTSLRQLRETGATAREIRERLGFT